MEHHPIARLEEREVALSVVGVGLMALGPAEMVASNFSGEASLLYEICNELRGLGSGLWNTEGIGDRRVGGVHECGSRTGWLVHCGPVGVEGPGNKAMRQHSSWAS